MTALVAWSVSLLLLLLGVLLLAFWAVPPHRCPRCGRREWVPLPHVGPYVVYCRKCLFTRDVSKGE